MLVDRTMSGTLFDPFNLDPKLIEIGDIAHSLSNLCRFNGHCDSFYSVAEHSVWVAKLFNDRHPDLRLMALLHKAAEVYLACLGGNVRRRIPELGKIEDRILDAIFFRFDLPEGPLHPGVVRADRMLLAIEASTLMGVDDHELQTVWKLEPPLGEGDLPCLNPVQANVFFLKEFEDIMEARNNV